MEKRLLALKKTKVTDYSARGVQWGGGGGGVGTASPKIPFYFCRSIMGKGKAIMSHVNNVEGMKGAVRAVFYHSLSTDNNLQHQFCPTSERSWCKYQRSVAK